MSKSAKQLYEFGPFRLDVAERLLLRDGAAVELTSKVFDLLVLLVENRGRLLEKSFILERLWPDSFVEEGNLSVNVSALRRALGEQAASPLYIETVPKRGYRFIARVVDSTVKDALPDPADPAAARETLEGDEETATIASSVRAADAAPAETATRVRARPSAKWYVAAAALLLVALAALYFLWPGRFTGGGAAMARTIAVLPFKTLTASDDDQALGLGMCDALINRLGSLKDVTVRPTSSVTKYAGGSSEALAVGRELNVEAVLDGHVQRDGKMIRVTAQLLRVRDGRSLWSGRFDDFFTNLFAVQDSISEKMAQALSLRLTTDEERLLTRRHTENTEAYQFYVQGRYYSDKSTPDDAAKAIKFYESALEKDPDYALPYAGLANAHLALSQYAIAPRENQEKARAAVMKAISLDTELADAHEALANIQFTLDWDFKSAERSFRRSLEINPKSPNAHYAYSLLLVALARLDEALGEIEMARQFDPTSVAINADSGYVLAQMGRYDEAIEQGRKAVEMDPYSVFARRTLARTYRLKGMYDESLAEYNREVGLGGFSKRPAGLGFTYAVKGDRAAAEDVLAERKQLMGKTSFTYQGIAMIYAGLGDKDKAFEWIGKSIENKEAAILFLNVDREWESLRADPRFAEMSRRIFK